MNRESRIHVVLVNFNGGRTILDCLWALRQQTHPHAVTVVDNASSDDSLRSIATEHPRTQMVPLRRNVGFARAANIGALRSESAEVLVLLNPDTIPQPDFLERLVEPLSLDARIGAVAGTLVFTTRPDIIASAGIDVHRNGVAIDSRLGTPLAGFSGVHAVFGASGGAVAYRRAAFCDVGGFCEPFFLYLEDVDLAWRLRLRGWGVVVSAHAVATHDYSASAVEGSALKRRLLARNRIWTLARCLPQQLWIRDRLSIVVFDATALAFAAFRRDKASLAGRMHGTVGLVSRLEERSRIQSSASSEWQDLDRWVQPAISPLRLLQLRQTTARLSRSNTG